MKVIVEEADKMERLVKDMLDLAKLESGTLKLRKMTFILSELVEEVVDKLFHLLKEKKLEVVIIPANEMPIHADVGWMEQVIINFVVNAIRHAEEGSSITIRIEGAGDISFFPLKIKVRPFLMINWSRYGIAFTGLSCPEAARQVGQGSGCRSSNEFWICTNSTLRWRIPRTASVLLLYSEAKLWQRS